MRRTPIALALVALAALVSVAGCSAPTPKPTATPRLGAVVFSGSTDGEKAFIVPSGAHSAEVTVACGGQGSFGLDGVLNTKLSGLNGGCDAGSHRYKLGVTPGQRLDFHLQVTTGALFVVETRFSVQPFVADRELASQCASMIDVGSDVFNAEEGYKLGALSLNQWKQKVAAARTALDSALNDKPDILTGTLRAMDKALGAKTAAPGTLTKPSDYNRGMTIVNQLCADTGDALYVNADYGG